VVCQMQLSGDQLRGDGSRSSATLAPDEHLEEKQIFGFQFEKEN